MPTCQLADGNDGGDGHADDDGAGDGDSDYIRGGGDEDIDGDDGGDEPATLGMHLGTWTNKFTKIIFAGGLALRTAPHGGWARAQTACGTEALDASSRFVTLRPVI